MYVPVPVCLCIFLMSLCSSAIIRMSAFLAGWLALSSVSVCLSVCLCDQQIVIDLANCRFVCLYLSLDFDIHLSVRLSGLITLSTLIQVSGS